MSTPTLPPTTAGETRSGRLDRALHDLLVQTPDLEAAAVVSFDGLPMASALPVSMDEDRVAAMSAALLSLGERATEGLGRGELNQVFIEGENGTVFLVSADNEAVLVAVAVLGAKTGMMLYEVRRAAAVVADVLRAEEAGALAPAAPDAGAAPAPVLAGTAAGMVPSQPQGAEAPEPLDQLAVGVSAGAVPTGAEGWAPNPSWSSYPGQTSWS